MNDLGEDLRNMRDASGRVVPSTFAAYARDRPIDGEAFGLDFPSAQLSRERPLLQHEGGGIRAESRQKLEQPQFRAGEGRRVCREERPHGHVPGARPSDLAQRTDPKNGRAKQNSTLADRGPSPANAGVLYDQI